MSSKAATVTANAPNVREAGQLATIDGYLAEMVSIRPALMEMFGKIPRINTYRQASIRCQKNKDWLGMRQWAEKGLEVYGEHPARPEDVDDLHKRLDVATAKLKGSVKG